MGERSIVFTNRLADGRKLPGVRVFKLRHFRRMLATPLMAGYLLAWLGLVMMPCLASASPALSGEATHQRATHHPAPVDTADCAEMAGCPHCPDAAAAPCAALQAADCGSQPALASVQDAGKLLAVPLAASTTLWPVTAAKQPLGWPRVAPVFPSPPFTELYCCHNE